MSTHAWVAGRVPSRERTRGNHTMFLSLSFSLPSLLSKKINKILKTTTRIHSLMATHWGEEISQSLSCRCCRDDFSPVLSSWLSNPSHLVIAKASPLPLSLLCNAKCPCFSALDELWAEILHPRVCSPPQYLRGGGAV